MISRRYLMERIKDIKVTDFLSVCPMLMGLTLSLFYKKKYKDTWIICEEKKEARDNGYWFYRKMCENHKEQKCVYAIDKHSVDYRKVKHLGEVVQYGSVKHWILYFTCAYNISSQKGGKPNAAICSFIELNNWYNAHNIFLQHGVIINNVRWLYADRSRFDLFITSTPFEKEFVEEKFGYQNGTIKLTGIPRFDNLHNITVKKNRIIIMPTWRYWFNIKSKQTKDIESKFIDSEYLQKWKEFLENDKLNHLIIKNQLEVIFYPHRNMQRYIEAFKDQLKSKVVIASWQEYDIQELLITAEMMITDYSSVFFDMVYMKKPVIFYQFDIKKYRNYQYDQGYFDYANNLFAKSCTKLEELLEQLEITILNAYRCDNAYLKAHKEFFPLYDEYNCERIFYEIKKLQRC